MDVTTATQRYLAFVTLERGLSAHTVDAYRRDLECYRLWLASSAIHDVTSVSSSDISEFVVSLRTDPTMPRAASSIQRILSSVRGLHRWLVREGLHVEDPTKDAQLTTRRVALPKALNVDDVQRLIAAAAAGSTPVLSLRDSALIELLYACGARISEAINLDADDVDCDDASVVLHGKGDKVRRVPLGTPACAAINAWLVRGRPELAALGRGSPRLFLTAYGTALSRQAGFAIVRDAAQRAGLSQDIGPHTLRHSCATHLLDAGADVRVVQELLGHSNVQTTQIYTMVTADRLREVHAHSHPRAR